MSRWSELNRQIIECRRCGRLVDHCENVAKVKRKSYREDDYWGKPVPNFGKSRVSLLIVGLAPGAHGANRTGRMFTGDRSGDWLYRAMYRQGFCTQPNSESLDDGLKLVDCAITSICHCAPPDNKPNTAEIAACSIYLEATVEVCRPKVILALGGIAWNGVLRFAASQSWLQPPRPKFFHGEHIALRSGRHPIGLIGCYHPSQQNTFTGRLTEEMLDLLFQQVRQAIDN